MDLKGEIMERQKLKGLIVANDGNQRTLADAMGISLSRLNAKINGWDGAKFTRDEMLFIRDRYHLTDRQFKEIFFDLK